MSIITIPKELVHRKYSELTEELLELNPDYTPEQIANELAPAMLEFIGKYGIEVKPS
jgi:hypothetical protein